MKILGWIIGGALVLAFLLVICFIADVNNWFGGETSGSTAVNQQVEDTPSAPPADKTPDPEPTPVASSEVAEESSDSELAIEELMREYESSRDESYQAQIATWLNKKEQEAKDEFRRADAYAKSKVSEGAPQSERDRIMEDAKKRYHAQIAEISAQRQKLGLTSGVESLKVCPKPESPKAETPPAVDASGGLSDFEEALNRLEQKYGKEFTDLKTGLKEDVDKMIDVTEKTKDDVEILDERMDSLEARLSSVEGRVKKVSFMVVTEEETEHGKREQARTIVHDVQSAQITEKDGKFFYCDEKSGKSYPGYPSAAHFDDGASVVEVSGRTIIGGTSASYRDTRPADQVFRSGYRDSIDIIYIVDVVDGQNRITTLHNGRCVPWRH